MIENETAKARPLRVAIVDLDPRLPNITSSYSMPRHGVLEVGTAASLAGHDVSVYVECVTGVPHDELSHFDVVGAAVTGSNLSRVEELFTRLRRVQPTIKLVAGGPHATLSPTEVARFADVVVRDEGEITFPEVLRAFQTGAGLEAIDGISYPRDGAVRHNPRRAFRPAALQVEDLGLLKGFRREPLALRIARERKVLCGYAATSRGCPFPCSFCYENLIGGTGFRRQPAEIFVENVRRRRDFFGVTHFWLADSNFTTSPKHCKEILEALIEADLGCTFTALCRVDIGARPDILELMRRAGFRTLVLGMEATDDDLLLNLNKRQTVEEIRVAVREVHRLEMNIIGLFMIGFDEDDLRSADRIVDFCEAHGVGHLCIYCLTEYPDLPGRTLPRYRVCEPDLDYYTGHYVTTFPLQMRPSELERSVYDALLRFYRPSKILERMRRGHLSEVLVHLGLHTQVREMARVSEVHRRKLERIERPYYGPDGRLRVDALRASPLIRHPLRPDVLAGWRDPEDPGPLVQLGVGPHAAAVTV